MRRRFADIEVDRLQVKPIVKITGEFYLQTVEGEPNYNIHRWLENEGAEVYPAPITVWLDYLLRLSAQEYQDHHGLVKGARLKSSMLLLTQKLLNWTYRRFRHALGNVPHSLPSQDELRKLAAPYYHSRMSGGEGDMLIGKALWAHRHQKAHMICELSPYGCMPNTMSVGAMASVLGNHPDLLYAPLEIKGDAEVHALSRCQMILTEAKRRAQDEFDEVIAQTKISTGQARQILHKTPHRLLADWPVPDMGVTGIAANLVLYLSGQKIHERLVRVSPKKTVAADPLDIPIEVRPVQER